MTWIKVVTAALVMTSAMEMLSGRQKKPWMRWVPGFETMRRYQPASLPHDIFAGLVLATMLVPVGIDAEPVEPYRQQATSTELFRGHSIYVSS
jgi:hypothetical protein